MAKERIYTRRSRAIEEAQGLGIDTDGMSTREVKAAIGATKEAQNEMAEFINKVLDSRPPPVVAAPDAAVVTNKTVEDAPSAVITRTTTSGDMGAVGVPIEFYTFVDGEVGKAVVLCQAAPSPL